MKRSAVRNSLLCVLAVALFPLFVYAQTKQTFLVPMRDGVKLATDVFLPTNNSPFPVILIRTPYNKDITAGAGTNAAKVVTATFSRAGTYVFTGRATDAQGLSITSQVRVEVTPVASKVFVLPSGRAVAAGGTLQLSGTVVDQFGDELAQPPPAEWTSNYGVIDENGLYTAAPQIYDDAITGWFPTDSGWMWDTVDVHVVGVGGHEDRVALVHGVAGRDPDDDVAGRALDVTGAVDELVGAELLHDGDRDR